MDLWKAFMKHASWDGDESRLPGSEDLPENAKLRALLPDGIHFNGEAYEILFKEWMAVVTQAYPDLVPEKMQLVFPAWSDEAAWETFDGPRKTS